MADMSERRTMIKNQLPSFLNQVVGEDGWGELFCNEDDSLFVFYTNSGILINVHDENLRIGFGLCSKMTPSFETLSAISEINNTMKFGGAIGLAAGSDNDNWNLVHCFNIPLIWIGETGESNKTIFQPIADTIGFQKALITNWQKLLPEDQSYIDYLSDSDLDSAAKALVLVGHIS